jgi:uncharacterized membrane protein
MKGYPYWFLTLLVSAIAMLLATGLLLAPGTLLFKADIELAWRLPSAYRILVTSTHAALGFLLMLLVGSIWSIHMRSGWRRQKQRLSGLLLAILFLILFLTPVAIYYAGEESIGTIAAFLHLIIGILIVFPFAWHWIRGHQSRKNHHHHHH